MIRRATIQDINQVWKLHEDYTLDITRINNPEYSSSSELQGFVVSKSTKEDVEERIRKSHLFNVYEEGDRILGLIDINKEIYFPADAPNIIWVIPELKEKYFHNNNGIVLHYIAVDPSAKGKGIAKSLLNNAIKQLVHEGYNDVFSIVTTGPLTNRVSITWHTKMGFDRACITTPMDLFGLTKYTSVLFHRSI